MPSSSTPPQSLDTMTSNLSNSTDITNEHDSASQALELHSPKPLKTRICRYFSKSGNCRAGDSCSFIHDPTKLPSRATANKTVPEVSQASISEATQGQNVIQNHSSQAITNPVPASRVVSKPVPQAQTENPREFQLGQIRRRFSPKEIRPSGNAEGTTILKFNLTPSDPDFPFEMTALECSLTVPPRYPIASPSLRVENKDIPRGFAINVENGFDQLVNEKENATLLDLMKSLDKHLEEFLSAQKAETVKIVMNKDTRHLSIPSREVQPVVPPPQPESAIKESEQPKVTPVKPTVSFTESEKAEASKKREVETRQFEARMGRLPLYKKSSDGIAYTIPIEPRKRGDLPLSIKAVKSIQLFVPTIYPLEPCRIKLEGVDAPEAKSVEKGFGQKAEEAKALNLMGHINYLAQNMHVLAKTALNTEPKPTSVVRTPSPVVEEQKDVKGKSVSTDETEEKSHIQYIARPPEWTIVNAEDAEYSDSESMYSYDSGDESETDEGGVGVEHEPENPTPNPERGTAISFPFIELYGIELLEVTTLNITVKCSRCREITEIKGLKTGVQKTETCRKCATALVICYRRDFVHASNVRAGFLDLEGCVVSDMLPSTFTPTCSTCSTIYPSPGIISIRGETTTNVCRECHSKFTFSIPTIKFLQISSSATPHNILPRKKKETLGIVPGTSLPKNGLCRHYGKSYRWFRFSCCEKVYACDKCHDETEEHVNEWAKRMICGWCSREGNYRPEDCAGCGERVISRRRGGASFWEGGKGTRDKTKMSRKDKRKYRRVGGGTVKKT
ncbi:hypothetical protein BCIN_13g05390 [Botrytis cinerea B05.10]|uniref:CHY-type domain-containing protein n=1 Tax=Botryotinia fuckeliana (strain B05.10) TaxID=332648 RepID=A0A384K1J3_BOTFB|nr:hypothetical protein BCIN_13g05390 [Botrytis cinerea B05.10]ATZ56706.1 hypothetical protein BCIN_13g05390 [Botrytis cinerea B05.10]